jgi:hypothetical protein
VLAAVGAGVVLAGAGCSGEPPLYPVEGTVTVGGAPLTTGDVLLYPDDGAKLSGQRLPQGKIDGNGAYRLSSAGRPGAPAGRYRVAVVAQTRTRPPNVPPNPMGLYPLIPQEYLSESTTTLRLEVPAPAGYDLALGR